jgi:hypothetical protein
VSSLLNPGSLAHGPLTPCLCPAHHADHPLLGCSCELRYPAASRDRRPRIVRYVIDRVSPDSVSVMRARACFRIDTHDHFCCFVRCSSRSLSIDCHTDSTTSILSACSLSYIYPVLVYLHTLYPQSLWLYNLRSSRRKRQDDG